MNDIIPSTAAADIASTTSSFIGSFAGVATLIGGIMVGVYIISVIVSTLRGEAPAGAANTSRPAEET